MALIMLEWKILYAGVPSISEVRLPPEMCNACAASDAHFGVWICCRVTRPRGVGIVGLPVSGYPAYGLTWAPGGFLVSKRTVYERSLASQ